MKNRNAGLNLNAETSVGTRRYGATVNGNYAFNNFNFRWNSSYNSARKLGFQDIERDFLLDDTRENISSLYVLDGDVLRFGDGVDFTFYERHQFSISSEYSDDSHTNNIDSHFFDLGNSFSP
ncbi:hypothetical protein [Maribacter sp. 4G9]|uniref:hypothetical protein n=1 Tax=Maribacter sp. 4G9 TaxID=1889777 RepID=UPI000F4E4525|nr:hypothetical protein [Maribacter sp. 4G9]